MPRSDDTPARDKDAHVRFRRSRSRNPSAPRPEHRAHLSGKLVAFRNPRDAALMLLASPSHVQVREARFLGQMCATAALTARQEKYLQRLLRVYQFPPLVAGDN